MLEDTSEELHLVDTPECAREFYQSFLDKDQAIFGKGMKGSGPGKTVSRSFQIRALHLSGRR